MNDRRTDDHLSPLVLAQLAEGGATPSVRMSSARHLAGCRSCTALFAEFTHAHLDPERGEFATVPEEWERLGREVGTARGEAGLPSRGRRIRRFAPVMAAAAGLTVVALLWGSDDGPRLSSDTRSAVLQMVREDSYKGLLYTADHAAQPRGIRGNASAEGNLEELDRLYSRHPDDAEVTYWLVSGSLAANQLRRSDSYLEDALRRFPRDPRFLNLAAILAFKRGDLAAAERHLRAAIPRDSTGVATFNLVRVLTELGRFPEAASLETELHRIHPDFHSESATR